MATYQDGLEAAAKLIEEADGGLLGAIFLNELAQKVREIREPGSLNGVTVISGADLWFARFKEEYPEGQRNHWSPARKAFDKALKRGNKPEEIIAGTRAFAMSGKGFEFIEAPTVFLNQDRFKTQYAPAPQKRTGSAGLFGMFDS